jgi:hypothetical protein
VERSSKEVNMMDSRQWYSWITKKPKQEQERIRKHWDDSGQEPTTDEEKQWYNETQGSSPQEHKIRTTTPAKVMTRREAINRYGFNPLRTIKNAFVEPENEWIARKQREEQINNRGKEAYYRGMEARKVKESYKKGRSGGGGFLGSLGSGLSTIVENAGRQSSTSMFDSPFTTGRKGRGSGGGGPGWNPITGEVYGRSRPKSRHKHRSRGKTIIIRT